jgi:hypothetical protein
MRPVLMRRFWLLPLVGLLLAAACGKPAGKEFYNVRRLPLTDAEKGHVLEVARADLSGRASADDADRFQNVYENEPRGVFLTLARPNQPALTAYGWGQSVRAAIKDAAANLKRLAESEDIGALNLRADVMDETTDEKELEVAEKWSFNVATEGVIFGTTPTLALLPQELRDWGVVDKKGKFNKTQFRKLLKHRGAGRAVRDAIEDAMTVPYAKMTVISFMEGEGGKVIPLRRGNRTTGFEPTVDNLTRAITAAGDYLARGMKEDGAFDYLYLPHQHTSSTSYNELRHGGTIYAMTQIYDVTKDPKLLAAIERGLGWLREHTRGPNAQDRDNVPWLALYDRHFRYAKLGGAGLSLLAFGRHAIVTGDRQNLPLMNGLAKFIETMIEPNGDVRMRHYPDPEDADKEDKDVLYYPGEAFYGLATLHALDNNLRWIELAAKGIDYIADVRDAKLADSQIPPDHWIAYAINEVHKYKPKANHVAHGWRIFNNMDAKFIDEGKDEDYVGSYQKDTGSVAAACRLEATGALYRLAQQLGDQERMDRFYAVLLKGSTYLMRNQFNEINTMFFADPLKPRGGIMFSFSNPEIQIDFVQHAVSALHQTRAIRLEREGK